MKKHIPNFLTCMNLLCGCIALPLLVWGSPWAAYLIFIAAFFDLLDGLVARALNAYSPIGKELDSLADVVSFGVVPGAMMFALLAKSNLNLMSSNDYFQSIVMFFPFIITVFSALRLAKFNVDTRQTTSFIGLPTPANTILIASFYLLSAGNNSSWNAVLLSPWFILGSCVVLSYLLVSELPMFSLKINASDKRQTLVQRVFLSASVILFLCLLIRAIPIIIMLYILLSLVTAGSRKREAGS